VGKPAVAGAHTNGVANKAVVPEGCKSPHHQLPGLDGKHSRCTGQVTNRDMRGRKSLGCPTCISV
jgi:hypothetical protein